MYGTAGVQGPEEATRREDWTARCYYYRGEGIRYGDESEAARPKESKSVCACMGNWCGCRVPCSAPALCVCVCVGGRPFPQLCRSMQARADETVPPCRPPCSLLKSPQGPPVHKRTHPAAPSSPAAQQQSATSKPSDAVSIAVAVPVEVDASQGEDWLIRGAFLGGGGLGPQGLLSSGGLGKWTSPFRTWQNRQTTQQCKCQGFSFSLSSPSIYLHSYTRIGP